MPPYTGHPRTNQCREKCSHHCISITTSRKCSLKPEWLAPAPALEWPNAHQCWQVWSSLTSHPACRSLQLFGGLFCFALLVFNHQTAEDNIFWGSACTCPLTQQPAALILPRRAEYMSAQTDMAIATLFIISQNRNQPNVHLQGHGSVGA